MGWGFLRRDASVQRAPSPKRCRLIPNWGGICERLEIRLLLSSSGQSTVASLTSQQQADIYQSPLSFEQNLGQTASSVDFISHGPGYTLFLNSGEAVLSLQPTNGSATASNTAVLTESLVGSEPASGVGLDELQAKTNYISGGGAPSITNIPNYSRVEYDNLYPGIDLTYYGTNEQLEYDFTVAPGADPGRITLSFGGDESLSVNSAGDLVIQTAGGSVVQDAPAIYQEVGGIKQMVQGSYVLDGSNRVSFQIAHYDANKPLIIDPVLIYSTYLGGSSDDLGNAIAVDASGNIYVAGFTGSSDFPTTSGVLQSTFSSGSKTSANDGVGDDLLVPQGVAFIAKYAPGGTLIYSTYLGGDGDSTNYYVDDYASAIAVDSSGDAYVTGTTVQVQEPPPKGVISVPFPTTPNALQSQPITDNPSEGNGNTFVSELNPSGTQLLFSSYLNSIGDQNNGSGIAVDPQGNIYVAGTTSGNPYVVKLNSNYQVIYNEAIGGKIAQSNTYSSASGIAVDSSGDAYVVGSSDSSSFGTVVPPQTTSLGGEDVFVLKLTPSGGLYYQVQVGGSDDDYGTAIAIDSAGDAYVTGSTDSSDFPTLHALQATASSDIAGGDSAFVFKLDPAGDQLLYSTYLGGTGHAAFVQPNGNGTVYYDPDTYEDDFGSGIAVDSQGDAYVIGTTNSVDFPITSNALQADFGNGYRDVFVTELDGSGSRLLYSSFYGGPGADVGTPEGGGFPLETYSFGDAIAVDPHGIIYFTGFTTASDFPTKNAAQPGIGGGTGISAASGSLANATQYALDAFVVEFSNQNLVVTEIPVTATIGQAFAGVTVATFIAPNPLAPIGDFNATINWGDGNTSAGTVTQPNGPGTAYQVSGGHTYTSAGAFPIIVTVFEPSLGIQTDSTVDAIATPGNVAEATIAVNPADPADLYIATSADGENSGDAGAYSSDGGADWQLGRIGTGPDGDGLPLAQAGNTYTAYDAYGDLFETYLTDAPEGSAANDYGVAVVWKPNDGEMFLPLAEWTGQDDQPKIATGPGPTPGTQSVWVTWEQASESGTPQVFVTSAVISAPSSGQQTSAPQFVTPYQVPGSDYGFLPTLAVGPGGEFAVSWLDDSDGSNAGKIFVSVNSAGAANSTPAGFQQTPTAWVNDPSLFGTYDLTQFSNYRGVDGDPYIAFDNSGGPNRGRLYLVYSTASSPQYGDGAPQPPSGINASVTYDFNLEYSDDLGGTITRVTAPVLDGYDQFLPSVSVDPITGDVALTWYDTLGDATNQQSAAGFFTAISIDGGNTFSPAVQVSVGYSNVSGEPSDGYQFGDYDVATFYNSVLYAVWTDNSDLLQGNQFLPNTDIAVARIPVAQIIVPRPTVTAVSISATEGDLFNGTVATFTDPGDVTLAQLSATINWGDGSAPSTVTPTQPNGDGTPYQVDGTHIYYSAGAYPITVTVNDTKYNVSASTIDNVSAANGSQVESAIAVDPNNPMRQFVAAMTQTSSGVNQIFVARSSNGGATWSTPSTGTFPAPGDGDIASPMATFDQYGNLFLSYLAADMQTLVLLESTDGGQTFTSAASFNVPGASGTSTMGPGSLAAGPGAAPGNDSIWVSYDDAVANQVTVWGASDTSSGVGTFSKYIVPQSANAQLGGLAVGPNGQVVTSFISPTLAVSGTIYVSTDSGGLGGTFSAPVAAATTNVGTDLSIPADPLRGVLSEADLVFDLSSDSHNGRLYLVYTDSASPGSTQTHIEERYSNNSGMTWSAPIQVDNATTGSLFLPAAGVDDSTSTTDPAAGDLAITWYDTRNDPAGVMAQVYAAVSGTGGLSFTGNVPISPGASNATDPNLSAFGQVSGYGDYMGMSLVNGVFTPAWTDNSTQLGNNPTPPEFDIAAGGIGIAQVAHQPLVVTPISLTAQSGEAPPIQSEGVAFTANVATFIDPDPNGMLGDYTATVNWGDGTSATTATITANGGEMYTVSATHTYQYAGVYTATINVSYLNGTPVSVTSQATVPDAPLVAGSPVTISPAAGQLFTGVVGTFTDEDPDGQASDYTASIAWGDGQTSAGTIQANSSGGFNVTGSHTYAAAGVLTFTITITDVGLNNSAGNEVPRSTATDTGTANVGSPAPVGQPPPSTITAYEGLTTGTLNLASFTVAGGASTTAGAYSVSINWDDGSALDTGAISVSGSTVQITGEHTYASAQTFSVAVTLSSNSTGASGSATATIDVLPDVNTQVDPASSGPIDNPLTQLFAGNITLTNTGSSTLTGPFPLIFEGLPAGVTIANSISAAPDGSPILTDPLTSLAPGQSSVVPVEFDDPTLLPISYTLHVFDPTLTPGFPLQLVATIDPSLVSASAVGGGTDPTMSSDGQYVVFQALPSNLVPGAYTAGLTDAAGSQVYLRDTQTDTTTLVSVADTGSGPANGTSDLPIISPNGQYVTFLSTASNLVNGVGVLGQTILYLRNLQTGATTELDGTPAEYFNPVFSGNSQFLIFQSDSTTLVSNDTLGGQLYECNLQTGTTTLVTVDSAGTNGASPIAPDNEAVYEPAVSDDGRFVVFDSFATNLVSNSAASGNLELYVRDMQQNTTTLISLTSSRTPLSNTSGIQYLPQLSGDGSTVVYQYNTQLYAINLSTNTTSLVSVNVGGTAGAAGISNAASISDNGQYVAFESDATNLVATPLGNTDPEFNYNIYVRNLQTGTTSVVNLNTSGTEGANDGADDPLISSDGSSVLFVSEATNLIPNDTTDTSALFVHNLQLGTTTLVSGDLNGTPTHYYYDGDAYTGNSYFGYQISSDGQYVVFGDQSSNLVPNDNNGEADIFERNLQTETTALVSAADPTLPDIAGNGVNGPVNIRPSVSANGQYVAFVGEGDPQLVPGGPTGSALFVRNLQTQATVLVSVNLAGTPDTEGEILNSPVISADGQFVVFESNSPDLVSNDTSSTAQLFIRNLETDTTTLITVDQAGTGPSNGTDTNFMPEISANDRYVVFQTNASNLVGNDTTDRNQVFVRDLLLGTTTLVSVNSAGTNGGNDGQLSGTADANGDYDPQISSTGRYIAFQSNSSDLVTDDNNDDMDVFVRDMQLGVTTLVSVDMAGTGSADGASTLQAMTPDGRYVVFDSTANNLTSNDTTSVNNAFVRDLQQNTTTLVSVNLSGTAAGVGSGLTLGDNSISANGRFILFYSGASGLVSNFTGTAALGNIYVRDMQAGVTTLVSVSSTGTAFGNSSSGGLVPQMSANGTYVLFVSSATNLVANGATITNGQNELYIRDLQTGTTTLVSESNSGAPADEAPGQDSQLSSDGSTVVFDSGANNLIPLFIGSNTLYAFTNYVPGLLVVTAQPIHAVAGSSFTGVVASFTNTNGDSIGNYTALINWGDGATSAGVISANSSGGFNVTGTHTFAEEGFYPIDTTVSDSDGTSASASTTVVQTGSSGDITYTIDLNTSALQGTSGDLNLQFNPGAIPSALSATATISDFTLIGGSLSSGATDTGGASGSLAGSAQLSNTTVLNEIDAGVTFGTGITFKVTLSGPALQSPDGDRFDNTFAVQLLGSDGITPQATTDPSGAVATVNINPDGSTTVTNFVSSAQGGTPVGGTPNVTAPATVTGPATVANQYLFYYGSTSFDGSATSPSSADQQAIATNKTPLLPGGTATFSNVSSYIDGINGILIDFDNEPAGVTFSAGDFQFAVGANSTPSGWAVGPAPSAVATWVGANGDTFADIVWPKGAIRDEWLQVTVLADANTNLAANDVFYFASLVGATGASISTTTNGSLLQVTPTDVQQTELNLTEQSTVPITNLYDFDRNGQVTSADVEYAELNLTEQTGLQLINLGSSGATVAAVPTKGSSTQAAAIGPSAPTAPAAVDSGSAIDDTSSPTTSVLQQNNDPLQRISRHRMRG